MATISRFRAVAMIGKLRLTGFVAWLLWLAVHLLYLTGFKNRVTALLHWAVSFVGRGRSERTSTEQQIFGRSALQPARPRRDRPGLRPRGVRRRAGVDRGPAAGRSSRSRRWPRSGSPTRASAVSRRADVSSRSPARRRGPWPTPMQIAARPQRSRRSTRTVGEGAEHAGTGGAQRMTDGDRAAAGVDDRRVDAPRVEAGQGLDGERLVELDRADVRPADPGRGEGPLGGLDRARSRTAGGSRAAAPRPAIRASGSTARSPRPRPAISRAAAPSLSGDALPAVIVPSGRKAGLSPARVSTARRRGGRTRRASSPSTGTTRSS